MQLFFKVCFNKSHHEGTMKEQLQLHQGVTKILEPGVLTAL